MPTLFFRYADRRSKPQGLLPALLSLILLPVSALYAQAPSYMLTGLGSPSTSIHGNRYSNPLAINNAGQIVGTYLAYDAAGIGAYRAFLFSHGAFSDLGIATSNPMTSLPAVFLNSAGQVVVNNDSFEGAIKLPGSEKIRSNEAFLYTGTNAVGLGTFATGASELGDSEAHGLNDLGEVVGQSEVYDGPTHFIPEKAFLYSQGKLVSLFRPDSFHPNSAEPGILGSIALGINHAGQVVGSYDMGSLQGGSRRRCAFLYSHGQISNLGSLGENASGPTDSTATAINRNGQVIGFSVMTVDDGKQQAFLYSQGRLIPLGYFGVDTHGHGDSIPTAINDAGQVIGVSEVYDTDGNPKGQAAFLYNQGQLINLGSFGVDKNGAAHSGAIAINNAGKILGKSESFTANGIPTGTRYFLYTQGHLYDVVDLIINKTNWVALELHGLNDAGQIIGIGSHVTPGSGICHDEAFVLDPILQTSPQSQSFLNNPPPLAKTPPKSVN